MTLHRSVEVERPSQDAPRHHASAKEWILVTLVPDQSRLVWNYQTRYSMFGTDRPIRNITLSVTPKGVEDTEQLCRAWGCVRYSTEADESGPGKTSDDLLWFYLAVPEEDFAALRLAAQRNAGGVSITFMVTGVSGFYAEWSPGISADHVKVLAGVEQRVEVPAGVGQLPRLGPVSECKLQLSIRNSLSSLSIETAENDEPEKASVELEPQPQVDSRSLSDKQLLTSIEALHVAVSRNRLPLWLLLLVAIAFLLLRVG